MAANYVLLERITASTSVASVTFNSIPQTGYTDLKIVMSSALTVGDVDNVITLNTSVTKNSGLRLYGNGTNKASDAAVGGGLANGSTYTANTFSSTEYYFPNYTSSVNKGVSIDAVTENNGTQSYLNISSQIFNLTSGITSIKLTPNSGLYARYSTFALYGISAVGTTPAIAPYAAGGDIIQTDGTYWYHAFLSSGSFVPAKGLTCDYLVVAGGGGGGTNGYSGGARWGAGGGAGGLRSTVTATGGGGSLESAIALASNTTYSIQVGAGGIGGVVSSGSDAGGTAGTNSVFSTITSIGGGYGPGATTAGGTAPTNYGGNGGSGGGAIEGGTVGLGTSSQGYNGGLGYHSGGSYGGGGGGGAGVAGSNAGAGSGGAGGNGVAISTFASATGTGVSNYYAGGGGGSGGSSAAAGGSGGGGTSNGGSGVANTGGGGSSSRGGTSGNGGSGIVIIRYAV